MHKLVISPRSQDYRSSTIDGEEGLVFLILAHNEEMVLSQSLEALCSQLGKQDQVHIVADRCSDKTAELALRAGAEVFIRTEPASYGKGAALGWWVERQSLSLDQPVVILDADSVVHHDFVKEIRRSFQQPEVQASQACLNPVITRPTPISAIIALSERVDQRFFDALRYWLGGSVRLRGTGMGFRYGLMKSTVPFIQTNVEDLELTLHLAARKVRIHFLSKVVLDDPKPGYMSYAAQQRTRWFQGQLKTVKANPRTILNVIRQGPLAWSLLDSMFAKPRTIFLPIKMTLLFLGMLWALLFGLHWAFLPLIALFTLQILIMAAAFMYALTLSGRGESLVLIAKGLPGICRVWGESVLAMSRPQAGWLRGRPVKIIQHTNESPQQS
jgi:cellulose synthase/poly-beta-1,6-N-acetylglucosamine synthase-like glycosyltransferase